MIPPFGFRGVERTVSALLALAAGAGLVVWVLGLETALAARLLGKPLPAWFVPDPGGPWLVLQSLLVMVGAVAGLMSSRWFSLVAVGMIAGLVYFTPVGLLTTLPAIGMVLLILPRLGSFWEFTPRWRGKGPPPPGQWRGHLAAMFKEDVREVIVALRDVIKKN